MFKHFLARRALQKLPTVNLQSLFPLVVLYKNCKRSILKHFPARRALQEKHMVNFQHLPRPQVLRRTANRVFFKTIPPQGITKSDNSCCSRTNRYAKSENSFVIWCYLLSTGAVLGEGFHHWTRKLYILVMDQLSFVVRFGGEADRSSTSRGSADTFGNCHFQNNLKGFALPPPHGEISSFRGRFWFTLKGVGQLGVCHWPWLVSWKSDWYRKQGNICQHFGGQKYNCFCS